MNIAKHDADADQPGPEPDEVVALLLRGKKVTAIKRYRELTGTGLKVAKEAIERMEARL